MKPSLFSLIFLAFIIDEGIALKFLGTKHIRSLEGKKLVRTHHERYNTFYERLPSEPCSAPPPPCVLMGSSILKF